jgi:hypothetical protein
MRPRGSKSELADKDENKEKRTKRKKESKKEGIMFPH